MGLDELKNEHLDLVADYESQAKSGVAKHYMLTIARDGESPARSIYFYGDAIEAAAGYGNYTDWGFARDFLTVKLYEPTGRVHEKVLRRPKGGECAFHREQYHSVTKILGELWDKLDTESYNILIYKFAQLFSKDNQRFEVERFLTQLGYTGEIIDDVRE
jgi:hypothetical protein